MALSKTTQDHEEIRKWAEERGAKPAEVASTERKGQTGIIRLEFPGAPNSNDSSLKEISWEEFFEKFDANGLSLTYQEVTADGEQSNFNKLVYPENAKASSGKKSAKSSAKKSAKTAGKTSAAKKGTAKTVAASAGKKAAKKTASKSAGKKAASKQPAKKTAVKASAKKTASKKTAAKSSAKKTAGKKTAVKKSGR